MYHIQLDSMANLILPLLLLAVNGPASGSDACGSNERHSLRPLHADSCVPDADVSRQLRLPDAQLLTGVADPKSCAMACARLRSACAVVQFRFVARLCHVTSELPRPASEAEAADMASRGDCVATLLRRDAPGATGLQVARRLSVFFDFRVSDRNLGGSDGSPASAVRSAQFVGDARRDSSGAALPGRSDSFVKISVESPGFRALVSASKEYSFFFSIAGMPRVTDQTHLLRIVPSSNPTTKFSAFAFFHQNRLKFTNLFTETVSYKTNSFSFQSQQKFFVATRYSNASGNSSVVLDGSVLSVAVHRTDYQLPTDIVSDEIWLGRSERFE